MRGGVPLAARAHKRVDDLKKAVHKTTPRIAGEDEATFGDRIRKKFTDALHQMHRNEHANLRRAQHKPHQGAKECARRVVQLQRGQISNYIHGGQYPGGILRW
jgi:hypothetical protein